MKDVSRAVFDTLRLLKPYDIDREKLRVGNPHDGAYIIVDQPPAIDIFSFGINDDTGFEQDMAARGHRLFMFDHTISGLPTEHANFNFKKLGICAEGGDHPALRSLDHHIAAAGAVSDRLILKIDVEGWEWEVFAQASAALLSRFDQILIEIHWMSRLEESDFRNTVYKALSNINQQFTLYHVHANNCCDIELVGGFPMANVLELSYVRTSMVNRTPSRTVYPTSINKGNHPHYFDLPLLFYPFLPSIVDDDRLADVVNRIDSDWQLYEDQPRRDEVNRWRT